MVSSLLLRCAALWLLMMMLVLLAACAPAPSATAEQQQKTIEWLEKDAWTPDCMTRPWPQCMQRPKEDSEMR